MSRPELDLMDALGCALERQEAVLVLVADELHDEMEVWQDKNNLAARDRLYRLWLVLQVAIDGHGANRRTLDRADDLLREQAAVVEGAK